MVYPMTAINAETQVTAQMLIRRPVQDVFSAFTDPSITSKFWFSRGSAELTKNSTGTWYWDWFGVSADFKVLEFSRNQQFRIEWGGEKQTVEWIFEQIPAGTMTKIVVEGFSEENLLAEAIDSKGGFTAVLAGAKAYLEHGILLNLVPDQHPSAHI